MMTNDDATLSKTILFLRLPLIIAVVFIHTDLEDVMVNGTLLVQKGMYPVYGLLQHVISNELARIAVPLFYFFSGFLFFYRSDFSLKTYGQKLRRRVRTLLVPYVFWNIVVFLLMLCSQLFLSSMASGRNKPIADYGWLDWPNLFWAHSNGSPVCAQFWFLRDLMVVIVFTPLLYCLIRYCNAFGVLFLGVLWLFDLWITLPGLSIAAFFFFTLGAWFGVKGLDFTASFRPVRWYAAFICLFTVVLNTCLWYGSRSDDALIRKIGIVVGLVAVVAWTACGIKRNVLHANALLAGSSFFVYACHGMAVGFVARYWVILLSPVNEWIMVAGYILSPLIVVGIAVGLYAMLHRYLPAFTALITGGR